MKWRFLIETKQNFGIWRELSYTTFSPHAALDAAWNHLALNSRYNLFSDLKELKSENCNHSIRDWRGMETIIIRIICCLYIFWGESYTKMLLLISAVNVLCTEAKASFLFNQYLVTIVKEDFSYQPLNTLYRWDQFRTLLFSKWAMVTKYHFTIDLLIFLLFGHGVIGSLVNVRGNILVSLRGRWVPSCSVRGKRLSAWYASRIITRKLGSINSGQKPYYFDHFNPYR